MPFIVGSNADEGTLIHPVFTDKYKRAGENSRPHFFYDEQPGEAERLLQFYPGLDKQVQQAEVNFVGDEMFGAKARLYAGSGQSVGAYHAVGLKQSGVRLSINCSISVPCATLS